MPFLTLARRDQPDGRVVGHDVRDGQGPARPGALPGTLGYVFAFGVLARRDHAAHAAASRCCSTRSSRWRSRRSATARSSTSCTCRCCRRRSPRSSTCGCRRWSSRSGSCSRRTSRWRSSRTRASWSRRAASAPRPRQGLARARARCSRRRSALLTLPVLVPTAQAFWTQPRAQDDGRPKSTRPLAHRPRRARAVAAAEPAQRRLLSRRRVHRPQPRPDGPRHADRSSRSSSAASRPPSNFIYQMQGSRSGDPRSGQPALRDLQAVLPTERVRAARAASAATRVYRFKRWQPQSVRDPGRRGRGASSSASATRRSCCARRPAAHGKLRLNVSYFSRWHAYRDGKRACR